MFTRISFRSVTAALGMGCLALSLLWLSLAASGSVESASFKEISTIPDPAVSPEGSGQEHEHSEENLAFFQPWHHQGTQAGLDEQGLKDADPLEGPNGWRVSFPFTRFFQVEFTERLLVAPFKGKGNLGFGRAP